MKRIILSLVSLFVLVFFFSTNADATVDINIESFSVQGGVYARGTDLPITLHVSNSGDEAASSVFIYFRLSTDSSTPLTDSADEDRTFFRIDIGKVTAGAGRTISTRVPLPLVIGPGTYRIWATYGSSSTFSGKLSTAEVQVTSTDVVPARAEYAFTGVSSSGIISASTEGTLIVGANSQMMKNFNVNFSIPSFCSPSTSFSFASTTEMVHGDTFHMTLSGDDLLIECVFDAANSCRGIVRWEPPSCLNGVVEIPISTNTRESYISASPDSVELIGVTQSLTVTNTGNDNLTIGDVTVEGVNAGNMAVLQDACTGKSLRPASGCLVTLHCNSENACMDSTLNVQSDADNVATLSVAVTTPSYNFPWNLFLPSIMNSTQ